ncbi:MAG TPA: slipin family protein [Thermomicrobiales bacterium]|nr:slipin family protein [Thermomicrobiales bacterium]
MQAVGVIVLIIIIFIVIVLFSAIKVVQEYERGVVFRLGRLMGPRGPGLIILIPFIERMMKVDLRTVTMDVPSQEVITRDNVTVRVNAVAYFRVVDANAAVVNVADYIRATSQIAQTTLRSILGQSVLDELLAEREHINQQLQHIIDEQTEPWGIKVSIVEVKDVELPQSMQRAMARQAEAEREKRAKIINAEGEFQASEQLSDAAAVIQRNPITIQLRYLQTLAEIATEKNSTIVFPIPIDFLSGFLSSGAAEPVRTPTPPAPDAPSSPPSPSSTPPPPTPMRRPGPEEKE